METSVTTNTSAFDLNAYLAELDNSVKRPTSTFIPEIRCIQGDVPAEKYNVKKGTFIALLRDENGNEKHEVLGSEFEGIILHEANQYAIYDEESEKTTFSTNEFSGGDDRIFVKDHTNNSLIADNFNQKSFKEFALQYFPNGVNSFGKPAHKFKFKFIFYVYVKALEKFVPEGAKPIFKIFSSVAALENVNAFHERISGHPIRYNCKFGTTSKKVANNFIYILNPEAVGQLDIPSLTEMCQLQMELREFIYQNISNAHTMLSSPKQPAPAIAAPIVDEPDELPVSAVNKTVPRNVPVTELNGGELESLFAS